MRQGPAELVEALVLASPDAIVVVDEQGRIELASPAVRELFGYDPDELLGREVEVLIPEEHRPAHLGHRDAYARHPAARPMGAGLDLQGRCRDGSTFPVDVSLAPTSLGGRRLTVAFVRDATERRRTEDLLRHVNDLSHRILEGQEIAATLGLTARHARNLIGATTAWVVVPLDEEHLVVAAADGDGVGELPGATLSAESSLSARSMAEAAPLLVEDMAAEPAVLPEARAAGLGPGAYLPMRTREGPIGTLVLARGHEGAPFDRREIAAVEVFVSAAAVVISLGQARGEVERLRLVAEQERIARDLHDTVIQRLFAIGMGLQSVEGLSEGTVAERIGTSVDAIDEVIREIRSTIFDLNRSGVGAGSRRQVEAVLLDAADQLGFRPRLVFRGPVESALSDGLSQPVLAVVREALSNAARHARASKVEVTVTAEDGSVTVSVTDDGIGMAEAAFGGQGLRNLAARAAELGGSLELSGHDPSGTALEWRVPIGGPPAPREGPTGGDPSVTGRGRALRP